MRIVVPAGSQEEFVYTDEEVSTIRNSIKIWSGDGLGDTEVLLSPVNKTTETGYTATYLTHGMPVEFDAEKDTWFKIGVNMQNPTNEDIIVYIEVENVDCATYTCGSGIIDSRVIIYDYANGVSYELSDRGYFDFTLRFNEADGYLYVDKTKYNTDELVETGRLVFKNNCIQIGRKG